jgi:uncharacterized protein (TIGR02246 family)
MRLIGYAVLAATALTLAGCDKGPDPVTQRVADRIAIEDLLVDYYANFGSASNENFADFYTEDAVFDVNGKVAKGREGITALYNGMGDEGATIPPGVFHMLLTNPQVKIDGDTATVKIFWTGVLNDKLDGPPHLQEHGREYDALVKKDGKWLIRKRVVIADSGMPAMFKPTYTPRTDYDVTKDDAPAAPASSAAATETPAG